MNNSNNGSFVGIAAIAIFATAWIGAGTIAWNWIEPRSFWAALKFLLAWGLLGYVAQLIAAFVVACIASIVE